MRMDLPRIGIVVPVFNEAIAIPEFIARLGGVLRELRAECLVFFVDDGSTDQTVAVVEAGRPALPGTSIIELSRNFGKENALLAGLDAARAENCDAVVMIDADLQHPPEMIPRLLGEWQSGCEVVIASRSQRNDESVSRRMLARLYYGLLNRLASLPIEDGDGDFRLMDRVVVDAICSLREHHRFMKGLYSWVGFRQKRLPTEYAARQAGQSSFNLRRLISLALEGITSFSAKPLRVALVLGLLIGTSSLAYAAWIVFETVIHGRITPGYASLFCAIMFLGGVQLISIGVLGEYVGRTYIEAKSRPAYVVRKTSRSRA